MEGVLLALAGWLEMAGLGPWVRGAAWAYPIANTLHLLGLTMLVGGIGIVDLRVVGLWRKVPLAALSAALTPVAIVGIAVEVAEDDEGSPGGQAAVLAGIVDDVMC